MTDLIVDRRGAVVVVRLNRPEARNALTGSLMSDLGSALVDAERDVDVRAVVLTGTGDRAFCAGLDLREFAEEGGTTLAAGEGSRMFQRLLAGEISVPIVGAANASAVAGGFELLLGCDVVVASSLAMFGLPEVQRGLFPGGNGTALATRIPMAVALELLLTGERISAQRAFDLGLVNHVVEPADVEATAVALAERIAANAPLSLQAVKELGRLHVTDPAGVSERLRQWQARVFSSKDAVEGATAFVEKRPPVWTGE